jgi:hypothetical protein
MRFDLHKNKKYRLILSLYDYSGAWAKPYIEADYPVMLWDKKCEGDILDFSELDKWLTGYEEFVYGLLAAPPCTDFAGSGARWWKEKDTDIERISTSIALVEIVLLIKSLCPNIKFWSLENPVGRIESLVPSLKPYRKLLFNPCDYGDPYTKKTVLWGEFNTELKKNPVEPEYIIWAGKKFPKLFAGTGGKSEKTKAIRSTTPAGFARSFFYANQ